MSYGFPPLIGEAPRVLILGSMPSVVSLQRNQYYAHPRNSFWPIMSQLFGIRGDASYEERANALTGAGVAVWDVMRSCERQGSLDSSIKNNTIEVNNFEHLLCVNPTISRIYFNGAKAEAEFLKRVLPAIAGAVAEGILLKRLPSTSPAHASMNFEQKLAAWRNITSIRAPDQLP